MNIVIIAGVWLIMGIVLTVMGKPADTHLACAAIIGCIALAKNEIIKHLKK